MDTCLHLWKNYLLYAGLLACFPLTARLWPWHVNYSPFLKAAAILPLQTRIVLPRAAPQDTALGVPSSYCTDLRQRSCHSIRKQNTAYCEPDCLLANPELCWVTSLLSVPQMWRSMLTSQLYLIISRKIQDLTFPEWKGHKRGNRWVFKSEKSCY